MVRKLRMGVAAARGDGGTNIARVARMALAIVAVAACGGGVAAGGGDAGAGAAAAGAGVGDGGAGADASAGSVDASTTPTIDASSACGTLSDFCAPRGVCNLEGAAASCASNGNGYTPAACGGFIVVTYGSHGPPDSPSTILYYDAMTGQLVEADEYSGANPTHLNCAIGGREVPAPSSCALAPCPQPTRDAGACPAGIPMNDARCAGEGAVCPVGGGCAPTCECFAGAWRCGPAPPCGP